MEKIMVAMSGGVDSSVAAAVLKEQGKNILGATLRLTEDGGILPKEALLAKEACDRLGIPEALVEQDNAPDTDSYLCMKKSFEALRGIFKI